MQRSRDRSVTDPELRAAGFDPTCHDCREAVSYHREACANHYVPTHKRSELQANNSRTCPSCDGHKRPEAEACRRCYAAGVR